MNKQTARFGVGGDAWRPIEIAALPALYARATNRLLALASVLHQRWQNDISTDE